MKIAWRDLEREIIEILRDNRFEVSSVAGESFIHLFEYDFPTAFSLTVFAKDLAKRMENAK